MDYLAISDSLRPLPHLSAFAPALLPLCRLAAGSPRPTLIVGEDAAGRRAVARWIHSLSDRGDQPMRAVDARHLPWAPEGAFLDVLLAGGSLLVDHAFHTPSAWQPLLAAAAQQGAGLLLASPTPEAPRLPAGTLVPTLVTMSVCIPASVAAPQWAPPRRGSRRRVA